MRKNTLSESGLFNSRIFLAFIVCSVGASLAVFSFAAPKSSPTRKVAVAVMTSTSSPTFGHPVISGIGGNGFEPDLRLDPSDPNRVYTSAPGSFSANTSWIWRSIDGGKSFKWVAGAAPFEGKVTGCAGGADTELAVDSAGHLYFNDLTIANFSTARSDDSGTSFTCSNTGVPDAAIDRAWYAVDADPTNGGILYLVSNEVGNGGVTCGGSTGLNNVLVMYRSPAPGAAALAGIQFGPANKITGDLGCDEGLPGNNEVSPVATTLGQPDGSGGFATLSTPVKHVYAVHPDAGYHQMRMARCFPVTFGPAVPNVSDPSGLNCTDVLIAEAGTGIKNGGTFPSMAIDKAGNLYVVWEEAPIDGGGMVIGDTVLKYSYSTDQGNTWAPAIQISTSGSPVGTLHNNVFAWIAAGDDGKVDIAWYGTAGVAPVPSRGPDSCPCDWSLWLIQSLNAHDPQPSLTAPILASEHFIHRGTIQTFIGGQSGDRHLGDFIQLRIGPFGEAQISYADSNNLTGSVATHAMYVRQNGGDGLYATTSPVNIPGLTPFDSVTDPVGDAKYEAGGTISANMPNLDIIASSVSKITTGPCNVAAPCYRVVMQLNNLSFAPDLTNDPNPDLVWLTQWLVPSTSDPNGGKNFFVYAESMAGGAVQCFAAENHATRNSDWFVLTYPGKAPALPAANCDAAPGPNGTITIDVPLSLVSEANPIDDRLHEVTASTMTLQAPADATYPPIGSYGGSLFNLIDVAQPYVVKPGGGGDPAISVVSRKVHGSAGTFDIVLPLTNPAGIECRKGQGPNSNEHDVVVTFVSPVTIGFVTNSCGTGSTSTTSGNETTIHLTGVSNAQCCGISLHNVSDGTTTEDVAVPICFLLGDTTANRSVNSSDVSQTKAQSGKAASATNFRTDVTVNGLINSSDVSTIKSKSGTALP